jgi:RNA polymerase sigma-70 factor (ECF subfamily)
MDRDLVEQATHGDQRALESLLVMSHPRLYRVAYAILRDRHLAEDATQRALLGIWRDIRRLRDPAKYEGWANRLLVRICYDEAKRRRAWIPDLLSQGVAPQRAPDQYDAVLDRDQLERGFRHLSVEHRAVLVLRCMLDMPMELVAETLGVAPGTVGSRLSRAIGALRTALEADARAPVPAPVRQEVAP